MPQNGPDRPDAPSTLRFVSTRDYPRFDVCIASEVDILTRTAAGKLIRRGDALLDSTGVRPSHPVLAGQCVEVSMQAPSTSPPTREEFHLPIVHEDDNIVVVDKPAGLVVHPAPGHPSRTLVNMLLGAYEGLPGTQAARAGIVHRLDKDTSGLLVVAKTEGARAWLVEQFKAGAIHKTYLALLLGYPDPSGSISQPLGRHPVHRKRIAVIYNGRPAHTAYSVSEYFHGFSLVSASPTTGRTHQLRVHFASIGHPIAGDKTYGGRPARQALTGLLQRQFLHAHRLAFSPPWLDRGLDLMSPLPDELQRVLDYVRRLGS